MRLTVTRNSGFLNKAKKYSDKLDFVCINFVVLQCLSIYSLGSRAARTLHGLFLCPATIPVAQPRGTVVMAVSSPAMCLDSGKWATAFLCPHV